MIDPVLGYCARSGRTSDEPLRDVIAYVRAERLSVKWILETHAHADHLSGAPLLQAELGGSIAIGSGIRNVQAHFGRVFNLAPTFVPDGAQFDRLFEDGDTFELGDQRCEVIATPGHTNDSMTYRIGDAAFIGDTLFMPDIGSARCDFPGGDAGELYDSIQRLLALPDATRLFVCHDYPPAGRDVRWEVSVQEQRRENIHVGGDVARADYVQTRKERDATLALPALIVPAIQVNIRAGRLPEPEDNGVAYLRMPLDLL